VLLALADPALKRVWDAVTAERGHDVRRAMPGLAAWQAVGEHQPHLLVVERTVSRLDALELCRRVRRLGAQPRPGIVILLPASQSSQMVAALKAGADDVLVGAPETAVARSHLRALEWRLQPPEAAPTAHELRGYEEFTDVAWATLDAAPPAAPAAAPAAAPRRLTLLRDEPAPPVAGPDPAPEPVAAVPLRAIPDAALVVEADGAVRAANARAETLFGRREGELRAAGLAALLRAADGTRGPVLLERLERLDGAGLWGCRADGSEFACEARAGSLAPAAGVLLVVRETHAHERRASQEREAPKMAALGTLARGIANDFNNVLAAIAGSVEAAELSLRGNAGGAERDLACAREAARDAARLVRRLRQIAAPAPSERRPVDPARIVEEAVRLLRRDLPPTVRLTMRLDHGGWRVQGDFEQLCDILVSLGRNARDAMPGGGALTIGTARLLGDDGREFVRFDVADTGHGIRADVLPRIFDPFFTTKAPGEGAGLGLATVYGVLQQHEGGVTVESTPEAGSVFHVFVPRTRQALPSAAAATPQGEGAPGGAGGLVLLVDDEAAVRRPLRQALEHHGYAVIEAADGEEALERFERVRAELDLVVVDHQMPRLSGWTVLEELKRRAPDLPVVLMSGHTLAEVRPAGAASPRRGPDAFLRKPFELGDLAATVARLLPPVRAGG
jgi:signal transduction histidine kinase/DNA-binding response OmpR family regulator